MIVWGGISGERALLLDGAAYDPATDTWTQFESTPFGTSTGESAIAWTGDEVVVVGALASPGAALSTDSWAFNPTTRGWRPLPSSGLSARGHVAGWDGEALWLAVIDDGRPVGVARLDLSKPEWESSTASAVNGLNVGVSGIVWTGGEFIVTSHLEAGAIFDTATREWSTIPVSGALQQLPAVWTGTDLVTGERRYKRASNMWTDIGQPPGPAREFASAVWTSHDYILWGGDACGSAASCVQLRDPEIGGAWRPGEPTR